MARLKPLPRRFKESAASVFGWIFLTRFLRSNGSLAVLQFALCRSADRLNPSRSGRDHEAGEGRSIGCFLEVTLVLALLETFS
jgi:hypothetical protein